MSKYLKINEENSFDTLVYLKKSKKGKELGEGRSLSVVAEKLGINIKTADLHSAEYDTELLEEVYKALERMDEDIENFVFVTIERWGVS